MESDEGSYRKIVRVRSKKDGDNGEVVSRPCRDSVSSVASEEEVDPYTKRRRESLKNNVYDICLKVSTVSRLFYRKLICSANME